jgi:hypothetical protein
MYDVLNFNLTALSEESGELALSMLTRAQSPQTRGDFEQTNKQWRRIRIIHEARLVDGQKHSSAPENRKRRFIGML